MYVCVSLRQTTEYISVYIVSGGSILARKYAWGIFIVFCLDLNFLRCAFLQEHVQPPLHTLSLPRVQGAL